MIIPAILSTVKGKLLLGFAAISSTIAVSEVIMGQLIASIPPTLAVLVSLYVLTRKQDKMAIALDGKLDAFMDAKVAASKAAGKEEERIEARARQGEAAIATQNVGSTPAQGTEENPVIIKQA